MRIYLDNCAYNRPYDDQSYIRIRLETQAKIYIQNMVKDGKFELVTSYVLDFENSSNPYDHKKNAIEGFINDNTAIYVSDRNKSKIERIANEIMATGVKEKDAYHISCAILAECSYLITTDDRMLKYSDDRIEIVTPEEFIRRTEKNEQ